MDPAILPATFGLLGSLIGGAATFFASWLTQRKQLRAQVIVQEATKRETLYAEFIMEASRRLLDAWNHQAEGPDVVASLYASVERMRLISSGAVIRAAEQVTRIVLQAYADPNKTLDEARNRVAEGGDWPDPLKDFTEACRKELIALHG
jgi:hypothetical protein